jgi:phosphoribosylanthranilate isomerase
MWVKICGITRLEDAECAARFGADAVGFVFAGGPRKITPEQARDIAGRMPSGPVKVGVFSDSPIVEVRDTAHYCGLDLVQLHGDEDPDYCGLLGDTAIKAISVKGQLDFVRAGRYDCHALLFDVCKSGRGDSDRPFDWRMLRLLDPGKRVIVAGGLSPDNVAAAVREGRPFGVDVSSGVESSPGVKDPVLMYRFIERARKADYEVDGC